MVKHKVEEKHFNKYKNRLWLIKLKDNKYLHIKKPGYVLKYLSKFILYIAVIPFVAMWAVLFTLYDEIILQLPNYIKEQWDDLLNIFPDILYIKDKEQED